MCNKMRLYNKLEHWKSDFENNVSKIYFLLVFISAQHLYIYFKVYAGSVNITSLFKKSLVYPTSPMRPT